MVAPAVVVAEQPSVDLGLEPADRGEAIWAEQNNIELTTADLAGDLGFDEGVGPLAADRQPGPRASAVCKGAIIQEPARTVPKQWTVLLRPTLRAWPN